MPFVVPFVAFAGSGNTGSDSFHSTSCAGLVSVSAGRRSDEQEFPGSA